MMLGRPQAIEAEIGCHAGELNFLIPHALIGAVFPPIAGEDHHHADVHQSSSRSCLLAGMLPCATVPRNPAAPPGWLQAIAAVAFGRFTSAPPSSLVWRGPPCAPRHAPG